MTLHISAGFDAGNVQVLDASNPQKVKLAIVKDHNSEHYQWFHFRVSGARGVPLGLELTNAGGASYTGGWVNYHAVASTDRVHWRRVPTTWDADAGVLRIEHTPDHDQVWYAYFAPYSLERHRDLVARCGESPLATLHCLGSTLDGRDLDLVQVGEPAEGKLNLWLIARQHPGESMAEWWMEGFLPRLLDADDPLARSLREKAVFYVVPHMNPDGSYRGHLRTNAAGVNLNRVWHDPKMETEPEVALVRDRMDATGVDFCLDVHGDEALPYNFIAGAEGIPGFTEKQLSLQERFKSAYVRANPDFQTQHGYPVARPGKGNLSMCTAQIAHRFGCLSMTLEMPFKDNANAPNPEFGWSPERCRKLGASTLDALAAVIDDLR
ncbi:MAG: M14-type cytosolic carboxypeptidase [Bradymonadia bacterium]